MEPASMLTRSTHSVTRGSAASHLSRSLCVTRDECHEADSDHPCPRGQTPDQADDGADVSHEQTCHELCHELCHTMAPIVSEDNPELTEMSWSRLRLRLPAVRLSADFCFSIQC